MTLELLDRIDRVARDDPARVAYRHGGGDDTTYLQLSQQIESMRAVLCVHATPGDTVVLHSGNTRALPPLIVAALSAGLRVLPVHGSTAVAEVAALAVRTHARLIVSPSRHCSIGTQAKHLTIDAFHISVAAIPPAIAAGVLLLTSSGSTGVPKIISRSGASLGAVSANMVEAIGFEAGDRVLAAVPLSHSYGIEHGLLAPLWAGATVELSDGLDLPHFANAFARGVSIFPTVPAVLERLADVGLPGLGATRTIYSAGGPLPAGVRDRFVARHRAPVGQLYGSTEVGSVCYRRGGEADLGVGRPMRGVSIRVLDLDAANASAAAGAIGEVAIRAPSMFDGYVDGEPAPLVDGHFLTGDLGRLDDGMLVLTGRSKLLIDTGGPKVDPLEVERVIESHPAVLTCVVVPIRQSETVSRLRAVIVPRPGVMTPAADEIRAFARERLAPHKVPRVVEFRAELPRSAAGKVARRQLMEEG